MLSSFKLECGGVRCKKSRLKNQEKELGAEDWRAERSGEAEGVTGYGRRTKKYLKIP